MVRLAARRLAVGLITVLAVAALVFFAVALLPGDVVTSVLGRNAAPGRIDELRRQLGLDRPVPARFASWLADAARGDLGTSLTGSTSVSDMIGVRLRNTLALAACAGIVLIPVAFGLGAWAGARAGRLADVTISNTLLLLLALPEFAIGALAAYVIGVRYHVVPPVSLFDSDAGPWSKPSALALPGLTLVLANLGYTARLVRAGVANAMQSEYVKMARLNGVPERTVVIRYALRNAVAPGIQVAGLTLMYLLGGTVVVEVLFQYPGIGQLATTAASSHDYTTLTGIAVVVASMYVLVNLAADVAILAATPRLRTELG
jgi:peptide/nickel transport system permease protein